VGFFRLVSPSHRCNAARRFWFGIRKIFSGFWLVALCMTATLPALAAEGIEFIDATFEATDEGYTLSTNYSVDLTHALEDALSRGIPLHFKLQLEVSKPRWYWLDDVAIKTSRNIRVSYNVLTRQYRASVDGSLYRSFSRFDDLLALLRHPGRWLVAETGALKPDASYTVAIQFSLDVSQLPKLIQVNALGSGDWRMSSGWTRFNYKTENK
jgi:hypothetical protein